MARGIRYVPIMPIHGRTDAQRAAARLAPAFEVEGWMWEVERGSPVRVPDARAIEKLIVILWNELMKNRRAMGEFSGGLLVARERGRDVPAVLWLDPKLARNIRM